MIISVSKMRQSFRFVLIISGFVIFLTILQRNGMSLKFSSNIYLNNTLKSGPLPGPYVQYIITKLNAENEIQNSDIYENVKENKIVFVVLLDKLTNNKLEAFLASLSEVKGVSDALIIFSHSYYDKIIYDIIRDIDFCRVLQIFYPFSVQTHQQIFPGSHPNDCPTNINKKTAILSKCEGASFPDFRGHYRNPVLAEKKHHWWWTCNTIFEKMNLITKDGGIVIFLEHDFYFMKDFIYMALYMQDIAAMQPHCEFLSMGATSSPNIPNFNPESIYTTELVTFDPKLHSNVLAFDLNTWNLIISHYDMFCSVDDSSWLGSLSYISKTRKDGKQFKVMTSSSPRAYKMTKNNVDNINQLQLKFDADWFPSFIEMNINLEEYYTDVVFDYTDSEGGWADPRDQGLCLSMTMSKMKKVLMEMAVTRSRY